MKNKKYGPIIYKVVRAITLAAPVPIYLFLMATLFNVTPDFIINEAEISDLTVHVAGDEYFIHTDKQTATFKGEVGYNEDYNVYGITVSSEDIIKVGRDYYSYIENKETGEYELTDIKRLEIQKQTGYKVPVVFFISAFGVMIVILVVQNKMQWHRTYPKAAVLVALATGTIVLYLLNAIIGGILGVFVVATASWGAFLLEELIYNGSISGDKQIEKSNEVLDALKKALEG